MEPVRIVRGTAAPLDRSDVDTDQIIPAHWLKKVERTGFGEGLFESWRSDPEFVLNDGRYRGAEILVAGPNFGTGSSREHAVWAIMQYGFKAVVSPRFGDIFQNNSTKNGLVPVQVDDATARTLLDALKADPTIEISVDVGTRRLTAPAAGVDVEFPLADDIQERFLEGLDDIGLTMRQAGSIDTYEAARPDWLPTTA